MTLKEYLDNHKISSLIDAARFFNLSGKNPSTNIMRYIRGTRIPNKEIMKVIFKKTNGKVTPYDFYQKIWDK